RIAAMETAIGITAGALALDPVGEGIAVQRPQALEDMRKTANDYEDQDSAEENVPALPDGEPAREENTGNTGAVKNTAQKAETRKIQRRVMRKLSRKMIVSAAAAFSGKEEDMQAVQTTHTLSEKAMVSVQKLFRAALKSI